MPDLSTLQRRIELCESNIHELQGMLNNHAACDINGRKEVYENISALTARVNYLEDSIKRIRTRTEKMGNYLTKFHARLSEFEQRLQYLTQELDSLGIRIEEWEKSQRQLDRDQSLSMERSSWKIGLLWSGLGILIASAIPLLLDLLL